MLQYIVQAEYNVYHTIQKRIIQKFAGSKHKFFLQITETKSFFPYTNKSLRVPQLLLVERPICILCLCILQPTFLQLQQQVYNTPDPYFQRAYISVWYAVNCFLNIILYKNVKKGNVR